MGSYSRILQLHAALALFVMSAGCTNPPSARPPRPERPPVAIELPADKRMVLGRNLDMLFLEATGSFERGDSAAHAVATARLLRYASRVTVLHLALEQERILEAVRVHGPAPFLSFLLDYGVRLGYVNTVASRASYGRLRAALAAEPRAERVPPMVLFLRTRDGNGFERYSTSVARPIRLLIMSPFGERYSAFSSGSSSNFLNVIAYLSSCTEQRSRPHARDTTRNTSPKASLVIDAIRETTGCTILGDNLGDLLGGGGQGMGDLGGAVNGMVGQGFGISRSDCLAGISSDPAAEMVSRFEAYTSCRSSRGSGAVPGRSWLMAMANSGVTHESFSRSTDEWGNSGFQWTNHHEDGSTTELTRLEGEIIELPDGRAATGDVYREKTTTSSGAVSYYSEEFVGTTQEGTGYTTSYSISQDQNTGQVTEVSRTTVEGSGSVTYTSFSDAQGNSLGSQTSITITFDDGSSVTYTTTVDANGNATETVTETPAPASTGDADTGEAEASTPVDETMTDECSGILQGSLQQGGSVTKLETLIIPAIDDVGSNAALTACIPSSPGPATKCTSLFLCLEGTVDPGSCRCQTRAAGNLPAGAGKGASACQQINCGPDASCNPQTGTCQCSHGAISPPVGIQGLPVIGPSGPGLPLGRTPELARGWQRSQTASLFNILAAGCDTQITPCTIR